MTFRSTIQTARPTRSGTRGSPAMLALASVAVVLLALPAAARAGQGSTLAGANAQRPGAGTSTVRATGPSDRPHDAQAIGATGPADRQPSAQARAHDPSGQPTNPAGQAREPDTGSQRTPGPEDTGARTDTRTPGPEATRAQTDTRTCSQ